MGTKGLKLPSSVIESALTDNPGDIHGAAYKVLSDWHTQQENPTLHEFLVAVRRSEMHHPAAELQQEALGKG